MTRFSSLKALAIAGVTASLMGSAAFASMADYNQLEQSVKTGLESLQVSTDQLGQLTLDQVAQLSGILDSGASNADKAQQASHVIDAAVHPETISMTSPEGIQLMTTLKADMDRLGLTYAGLDKLNADQVQHVIDVINRHQKNSPKANDAAKQQAEAVFANFDRSSNVTATNAGVRQLEKQIDDKLSALGLTAPAIGALTFTQVDQLTAIFDQNGPQADQKAAAMTVLGLS